MSLMSAKSGSANSRNATLTDVRSRSPTRVHPAPRARVRASGGLNMYSYIRIAVLIVFAAAVFAQEKGELTVPENRSNPHSRTITIKYQRFPSTAKKPGYPIVYLAGGPGGSGIGALQGPRKAIAEALREFGDV